MAADVPGSRRRWRRSGTRRSSSWVLRSLVVLSVALVWLPVSAIASAGQHSASRRAHPHRTRAGLVATLPSGGTLISVFCPAAGTPPHDDDQARIRGGVTLAGTGDPDDLRIPRCAAVGENETGAGPRSIAGLQRPTGRWLGTAVPGVRREAGAMLSGVSCPAPGACIAVGAGFGRSGQSRPLALKWSGTRWRLMTVPYPRAHGGVGSRLTGVSCRVFTYCIAVGDNQTRHGAVALAELWNGSRWRLLRPVSEPHARASMLDKVSCPREISCMAVGTYITASGQEFALAEHWNGARWRLRPALSVAGAAGSVLSGVSCLVTSCIAVGSYQRGSATVLAERWNGATWSVLPAVSPGHGSASALADVACQSARSCTAVGYVAPHPGGSAPLIEAWNGARWQIDRTPRRGRLAELYGVTCPAPRRCVAVGEYVSRSGQRMELAEMWNGSTWSIQRTG
ncbi:MAG TPA: hypothetical protein VF834_19375 [Streptosporangiaceae bacterium]